MVLADDLTGACDAAAPFAGRGVRAVVEWGELPAESAAEMISICTGTRDGAPGEFASFARSVAGRTVFKKVDSTFRGNTFAEIAATVLAFPERLAVIAPAYPALGRTCREGRLRVVDAAGSWTLELREALAAAGVAARWVDGRTDSGEVAEAMHGGTVFCEARCDEELRAVVRAGRAVGRAVVWIGSGGLAHALAAEVYGAEAVTPEVLPGPLVCFVGSTHAVTARQLGALEGQCAVIRVERGVTAVEEIRWAAAGLRFGTLLLVGGDTALAVCRALGVDRIELRGEFAPGVAQGVLCGGRYAGTTVVLKSGGFGAEDLLVRMAEGCREVIG